MDLSHRPALMPGQPQDARVFMTHGEGHNLYCVYEHWIFTAPNATSEPEWSLFYVGACKLVDVFNTPDALRNTHFAKLTKGAIVSVCVVMTAPDEVTVLNEASKRGRSYKAPCNLYGGQRSPFNRVRCIETGVVYSSANACCAAMNIAQSQLSQHLRRMAGFKSVKGHTFEIVS